MCRSEKKNFLLTANVFRGVFSSNQVLGMVSHTRPIASASVILWAIRNGMLLINVYGSRLFKGLGLACQVAELERIMY